MASSLSSCDDPEAFLQCTSAAAAAAAMYPTHPSQYTPAAATYDPAHAHLHPQDTSQLPTYPISIPDAYTAARPQPTHHPHPSHYNHTLTHAHSHPHSPSLAHPQHAHIANTPDIPAASLYPAAAATAAAAVPPTLTAWPASSSPIDDFPVSTALPNVDGADAELGTAALAGGHLTRVSSAASVAASALADADPWVLSAALQAAPSSAAAESAGAASLTTPFPVDHPALEHHEHHGGPAAAAASASAPAAFAAVSAAPSPSAPCLVATNDHNLRHHHHHQRAVALRTLQSEQEIAQSQPQSQLPPHLLPEHRPLAVGAQISHQIPHHIPHHPPQPKNFAAPPHLAQRPRHRSAGAANVKATGKPSSVSRSRVALGDLPDDSTVTTGITRLALRPPRHPKSQTRLTHNFSVSGSRPVDRASSSERDTEAEVEAGADAEADVDADVDVDVEAEADAGADADVEAEAEAVDEDEDENENDMQAEIDDNIEAEAVSKSDAENCMSDVDKDDTNAEKRLTRQCKMKESRLVSPEQSEVRLAPGMHASGRKPNGARDHETKKSAPLTASKNVDELGPEAQRRSVNLCVSRMTIEKSKKDMDTVEKRNWRARKNRESADRSRKKKREMAARLQGDNTFLKGENNRLQGEVFRLGDANKVLTTDLYGLMEKVHNLTRINSALELALAGKNIVMRLPQGDNKTHPRSAGQ